MLIATLNKDLPELTDNLILQLSRDTYYEPSEIMVVDNGSIGKKATSTTHTLDTNIYFGGGANMILEYFLSTDHDYLYILNNDLIFHGSRFLSQSIHEAVKYNAAVYSPTIINASIEQCHWKQMWNWGVGCRVVKWVDFQCVLLRRDICKHIIQYPQELIYGWGIDLYTGCIADKHKLNTIISDNNTICHLNSQTFRQNKIDIGVTEFCRIAESNMNTYFNNSEYKELYYKLRTYGERYSF